MIRGALFLAWLVVSVVPYASVVVLLSVALRGHQLYRVALGWLLAATWAARFIGGVKHRLHGLENLAAVDSGAPVVLCPKHQSAWETLALPCMMPRPLAYVFKRELLLVPFLGWALWRMDMVHIDRRRSSDAWHRIARQGRELLAKGTWIIVFPEGTRTARGARGAYKTGAARLAVATGASLVPIALTSGREPVNSRAKRKLG